MYRAKVMLVEDDVEWSKGLKLFFHDEPGFEIVSIVESKEACMLALKQKAVDVVLMDIMLGDYDTSGLDAALDIAYLYPHIKVIMVSSLDEDDDIFNEAFLNGAYDFVYKDEFEKIPEVIAYAMNDKESKYGPKLRKLVYDKKRKLLSTHDVLLLKLILEGKTQQEIAELNSVSLSAVKKQVGRIIEKFHWHGSTRELADKCNKWGLLG